MNRQKGSVAIAAIATLVVVLGLVAVGIGSYVTNYNYGNRAEKQIVAAWENNENILGQYSLKIVEMAQVPEMYKNDVKEVYTAALTGRYGADGSEAMFQWLQEQNPSLDASVYTRLQQTMEAGRNEFRVAQTQLVDLKRGYETNLGYLWRGTWLSIAGYPKIDLDDYRIITSDYAIDAFESGVDKGIQLDTN